MHADGGERERAPHMESHIKYFAVLIRLFTIDGEWVCVWLKGALDPWLGKPTFFSQMLHINTFRISPCQVPLSLSISLPCPPTGLVPLFLDVLPLVPKTATSASVMAAFWKFLYTHLHSCIHIYRNMAPPAVAHLWGHFGYFD